MLTSAGNFGNGAGAAEAIVINAGAGNDSIDISADATLAAAAAKSITLGDGVDTVVLKGAATQTGVTVTDFVAGSGGDNIDFGTSAATGVTNPTKIVSKAGAYALADGMVIYTGNDAASLTAADVATKLAAATITDANLGGNESYIMGIPLTHVEFFWSVFAKVYHVCRRKTWSRAEQNGSARHWKFRGAPSILGS
jgi:hypothetical protein